MEKKGLAVLGNIPQTLNRGNNYVIASKRTGRYHSLIIRAMVDGQFVDPSTLIGKRVFYVFKMGTSHNQNHLGEKSLIEICRPYLLLYAKQENLDEVEGLPRLIVWQGAEKATFMGSYKHHKFLQTREIFRQELVSRQAGTHWDTQIIALCCPEKKCSIIEYYKSNLGNIHAPKERRI